MAQKIEKSQKTRSHADGRDEIARWQSSQPGNYFLADKQLIAQLERLWGYEVFDANRERLERFGAAAALIADMAARKANEAENLPRLKRFSVNGTRTEEVEHCLDHHIAGRIIYDSGAMSVYESPGNNLLALTLFYISSFNGEAGHNCPLACTAGVIKTLQFASSDTLRSQYLPRLLDSNYETRFHGAQFLTEIQGGSDVGSNACVARRSDRPDEWLISGEKWFCSNVTADLALVTARPEGAGPGTKGLGLFLVPRKLGDGSVNGIYINRLKDKLGTRSLATGEVEFRDAVAYAASPVEQGFQTAMDYVINTSRLYNAVGSAGAARRACIIATTYAENRTAFGTPIAAFPLIAQILKDMTSETDAIMSGSLYLAHLRDQIELGQHEPGDEAFFRFAVNLNKYRSSVSATNVIRQAIEVLGGNGAIESFSVLPRLLRDSLVFEAWEGAHNTLIVQSLRDVIRHRLHEAFFSKLESMVGDRSEIQQLRSEVDELSKGDEQTGSVPFRKLADRMMYLFYRAASGVTGASQ